jgi:hypothetical protein
MKQFWKRKIAAADQKEPPAKAHDLSAASTGAADSAPAATAPHALPVHAIDAPLEAHPLANLFPLLEGEEFAELVADIKAHGLIEPIVIHEGKILDGRNRYRACLAAGVRPWFKPFDGTDPVAFTS